MAEQPQSAKAQVLNDRTYQEVEYLKKNLGPILVAALAEICIRRPADPIEYLGHWLLRWRYNEELKRRDVQNALEVVRQKAWTKDDETLAPNPNAPDHPPAPETFTQGFTPGAPYAPPGFGGPLDGSAVEQLSSTTDEAPAPAPLESEPLGETTVPFDEALGEVENIPSGGAAEAASKEKRASLLDTEQRASGEQSQIQETGGSGSGEIAAAQSRGSAGNGSRRASMEKRPSGEAAEAEAPPAGEEEPPPPVEITSEVQEKVPSGEIQDTNNPEGEAPVEGEEPPVE